MINLGVEQSQTESVPEEIVILEKGEVSSLVSLLCLNSICFP